MYRCMEVYVLSHIKSALTSTYFSVTLTCITQSKRTAVELIAAASINSTTCNKNKINASYKDNEKFHTAVTVKVLGRI